MQKYLFIWSLLALCSVSLYGFSDIPFGDVVEGSNSTIPFNNPDYCADVTVENGLGQFTVNGVTAPWHRIQYRPSYSPIFSEICDDNCRSPQTVTGLLAGTYIVKVEQSNGQHHTYCFQEYTVEVFAPRVTDYTQGVSVLGDVERVTITGARAPKTRILYRLEGTETYFEVCTDTCNEPHVLEGLSAGMYIIRIEQSDADGSNFSSQEIAAIVTSSGVDYCANISVIGGIDQATISGVTAPWSRIQYRLEGEFSYTDVCNDNCSDPQTVTGLAPGIYIFKVEQSNGADEAYCSGEFAAIVSSGRQTDLCADVNITAQPNRIVVSGVNAVWNKIQVSGPSTGNKMLTFCEDCFDSGSADFVIDNLQPGQYRVITEESEKDMINYCKTETDIIVSE